MDQLIDIIFDNPFFIILIIGGVISLLKGKGQQEENEAQRQEQQKRTKQRQQQAQTVPNKAPVQQKASYQKQAEKQEVSADHSSAQQQWQQQMQKFADRLEDSDDDLHSGLTKKAKVADENRRMEVQGLVSKYSHKKFKKDFKGSLTKEGLINSIVMAEVLGAPRARNQYQSVIAKRKTK